MRPHYPDTYEGCINGCDSTLCEILQVNMCRHSPSTQSTQRNIGTNQNRGETISTTYTYILVYLH